MKTKSSQKAKFVRGFAPWPEQLIPWLGLIFARYQGLQKICFTDSLWIGLRWQDRPRGVRCNQVRLSLACWNWIEQEQRRWWLFQEQPWQLQPDHDSGWALLFCVDGAGVCHLGTESVGLRFRWRRSTKETRQLMAWHEPKTKVS